MFLLLVTLAHAEDIQVTSNLKGAKIFLDGADTGLRTPATIHNVAPGTVLVSVGSGCEVGEGSVTVTSGVTSRVSLMALPGSAVVTVVADPPNAVVFLDDQPYSTHVGEPTSMDCGAHTFRAEYDGFVVSTVSVDLKPDEEIQIPITLTKIGFGNLDLSVQPRTATMYMDGKAVGSDAVTLPSVAAGQHTISAKSSTYKTTTAVITVSDADDQAWHFDMVHDSSSKESTATQLRGPHPGEIISGSGTAAAPARAASTTTSKSSSSKSTSSSSSEKTASDKAAADKASSDKASSDKASSDKTTSTAKTTAPEAGGDDYFSRLRAEQGVTETATPTKAPPPEDDLDEDAPVPAKSTSSSSSKSTSSSSKTTKEPASTASSSSTKSTSSAPSSTKTTASTKPAPKVEEEEEEAPKVKSEHKNKTGLDVAGVTMVVLGATGGAGTYFVYDRTIVAYDAYNAKVAAGQASQDPELIAAAQEYYDSTLLPRRNLMYAGAGGTVALLATGITLILVDDHLPYVMPMRGGAMIGWGTSF